MRAERAIELAPGRDAVVMEARVRDMRRLLALLPDQPTDGAELTTLLRERAPDLVALLGDCLRLPEGETVDDLSVSECLSVALAWWELHADFFLVALGALRGQGAAGASSPTSTAPASSAPGTDTPASGTTAGAST